MIELPDPKQVKAKFEAAGLIRFDTTGDRLLTLISLLQLASRHPDLPPHVRVQCGEMIANLSRRLIEIAPEIAPLITAGNDPAMDVTTTEFNELYPPDEPV